jgi:hypothetical protein
MSSTRPMLALTAGLTVALLALAAVGQAAPKISIIRDLSLEFVGQFQNSAPGVTPATHVHYGYLSYIKGVPAFAGTPQDETTALFTFYADATTLRVIVNGPLRIVSRVGTLTIYRDSSTDGNFANPDTFRDGTPVLVASFRQQVVNNTITGSFTTFHRAKITSVTPFRSGTGTVQLGTVGESLRIVFNGQGNMPGPPSGYFGGYGVSG